MRPGAPTTGLPAAPPPGTDPGVPEISVVIPTVGRPALVVRAVASVLAQTLADLEVIVVIDGPDPATLAALAGIADPRLRVLENPTPLHVGATRNRGVAEARAPWIAFLDDDDEFLPTKLDRQRALAADATTIVMTLSRVATPRGDYVWPRAIYDNRQPLDEYLFDRRARFKGHGLIPTPSPILPPAPFERLRFSGPPQPQGWGLPVPP